MTGFEAVLAEVEEKHGAMGRRLVEYNVALNSLVQHAGEHCAGLADATAQLGALLVGECAAGIPVATLDYLLDATRRALIARARDVMIEAALAAPPAKDHKPS